VTETNVFQLSQPGSFSDPLTEVLRNGARALLAQAVFAFERSEPWKETGLAAQKCRSSECELSRGDASRGIPCMRVFKDFDEIKSAVGTEVDISDWVMVTQERINRFAEATGDEQ